MANQNAKIDENKEKTLLGVGDDSDAEILRLLVDSATGRLKVSAIVSSGVIGSLNGLTAATQVFAIGTSGTDFNIVSATDTHTFNIPTASTTNRGLLSSGKYDEIVANTLKITNAVFTKTFTVSPSGGDYTTVQAALDDNVTVGILILVYPGTYTDDTIHFTANNQEIRGMGISPSSVKITTASSNIVDYGAFTRCRINRMKMEVTAGTTLVHTVTGAAGSCNLVKCHTVMTTSYATAGVQPSCIHSEGAGTVKVSEGTVEYNHSGSNAAIAKALLNCEANDCSTTFELANINITCSGASFVSGLSFGTGATEIYMNRCFYDIEDNGTAIVVGLYVGGAAAGEFLYNSVHIKGTGVLAVGMYINAAGADVRSMYNHIHVEGATTNNSFFLNDFASTLTSQFDDLVAANGINNVGEAEVVQVNSESDGALIASAGFTGDLTGNADTVTDFTPASGSLTLSGADALTLTTAGDTNVTLPTTGTLATTAELHPAVTIGTANGLSLSTQALSLALADTDTTGALSDTDWDTFNGKQDALTFGIANTNAVDIDHAAVASTDYARFTANGLEGREKSEVLSDLNVADGADVTGSNAPQAHEASHAVGGADAVFPADPGADKVLQWDDSESALAWVDAGIGDMVLASVQSVTGLKTFDTTKLAMKGSSTGVNTVAAANVSATSYTNTIPAKTGTFAMTSDIPVKATGAEIDTGTDDAKFATAKAIKDSTNVPSVAPSTDGNVLTSDGTNWVSETPKVVPTGDIVGTTDTQTLTNKTLTSPVIRDYDGWQDANETWAYASVDDPTGVITVPTDATTKYSVGMRISFVNATNTIYGIITAVTATTITFLHEIDPTDSLALTLMANSAITVPKYSTQKAPFGFPLSPLNWTVETTATGTATQSTPTANTWYNTGSLNISLPIGAWGVGYWGNLGSYDATSITQTIVAATLSTANNSESDAEMTVMNRTNIAAFAGMQVELEVTRSKHLLMTSKTTYYLNTKTWQSGVNTIGFNVGTITGDTIIRAKCSYL